METSSISTNGCYWKWTSLYVQKMFWTEDQKRGDTATSNKILM
jgi:hypothetical protein